jgi:hypothetical protein
VDVQCKIEIPGIHFQDRKYSNENILTIKELMHNSPEIQLMLNISIICHYESSRGNLNESQGVQSELIPLISDSSRVVRG